MAERIVTYDEFWRFYLRAHRAPRNRALHYVGTGLATILVVSALIARDWRILAAAPVVGYACAWLGHGVFEHNRPETFGHPFWSLYSDFRMLALFLTGRMSAELQRLKEAT
jgi:hypothetical protein